MANGQLTILGCGSAKPTRTTSPSGQLVELCDKSFLVDCGEGVLLTMYNSQLNLTNQVAAEVKKFFPQKVFKTVIPRTVRLSEAPGFGKSIFEYDRHSKGADAYMALAKEILKNDR